MSLYELSAGERAVVRSIEEEMLRIQMIRLGFFEGSEIKCLVRLAKGPIVIKHRGQDLAIGRNFAEKIKVDMI